MLFTVTYTALPSDFYFFKLTQPLTLSIGEVLYTVKEKGGKPDRKPHPLPYGLRNLYRNLKSQNSQDYAQKPQVSELSRLCPETSSLRTLKTMPSNLNEVVRS